MKKTFLTLIAALSFTFAMAQTTLEFPFQGGKNVMMDYFSNHITLVDAFKKRATNGTVVMKFTADEKGAIIKMVIYYADDANLAEPIIKALKGTEGKWIIPAKQKTYDFLIPFAVNITQPDADAAKAMLNFYNTRQPINATDQVPLDMVSLLPTVQVKYTYGQ